MTVTDYSDEYGELRNKVSMIEEGFLNPVNKIVEMGKWYHKNTLGFIIFVDKKNNSPFEKSDFKILINNKLIKRIYIKGKWDYHLWIPYRVKSLLSNMGYRFQYKNPKKKFYLPNYSKK